MSPMKMARLESALRIVLDFSQAFNRRDIDGMMMLASDDCRLENAAPAPDGVLYSGREGVTRYWQDFFSVRSQMHREVEEAFGLGFRCILRWKDSWVDPGGNKRHARGVDIFDVKNGFIKEQLSYVKGSGIETGIVGMKVSILEQ